MTDRTNSGDSDGNERFQVPDAVAAADKPTRRGEPGSCFSVHKAGVTCCGTAIKSPPAERPNGAFVAYFCDPNGNRLTARTQPTK